MDEDELLSLLHRLVWNGTAPLTCEEPGHADGHTCLPLPDGTSLAELAEELDNRYGDSRWLAWDGDVHAEATDPAAVALIRPFGERVAEMRAWPIGDRWIGCGTTVRGGGDLRPVVLVANRTAPVSDGLPADASWVDRLIAVTGWHEGRACTVDWAAAEARLGTAFPSDYKRLVECFGHGAFDGFLDIRLPDDIISRAERAARSTEADGRPSWEPYPPFPAPGGLLPWADNEWEQSFHWITEGADPDKWPVYVTDVSLQPGKRFDVTATEFLFRILTDPRHPYSMARGVQAHWWQSYNSSCTHPPEDD